MSRCFPNVRLFCKPEDRLSQRWAVVCIGPHWFMRNNGPSLRLHNRMDLRSVVSHMERRA